MRRLTLIIALLTLLIVPVHTHAQDNTDRVITTANVGDVIQLATLDSHFEAVHGVTFSPDSDLLASAADDFTVRIWHVASTGQQYSRELHAGFVRDVAFTTLDDQLLLASAGWDRLVILSDVPPDSPEDTEQIGTLAAGNAVVDHVVFSPDGTLLAQTVGSGIVAVYDTAMQEPVIRYEMPSLQGTGLAFSPRGRYLAAASGFPSTAVSVFDLEDDTTDPAYILDAESATVTGLVFLPADNDTLPTLTAIDDAGGLRLWQIDDEATIIGETEVEEAWLLDVAVNPAGDLLATTSLAGQITLWDISDSTTPQMLTLLQDDGEPVHDITFSPDGTLIATAEDSGLIRLWGLPLD